MSLADLGIALRRRNVKVSNGAKCAIIFDSTPAPPTLSLAVRAFTASIRSRFQKLLFAFGLSVVYFLTFVVRTILRQPEAIALVLKQLNDPRLLPWTSVRTPRMYFYSSGDRIVPASDVEEHAAGARMSGFHVQMLNFGKSGHVSHARDYPEKYWEAVRAFWNEAVTNQSRGVSAIDVSFCVCLDPNHPLLELSVLKDADYSRPTQISHNTHVLDYPWPLRQCTVDWISIHILNVNSAAELIDVFQGCRALNTGDASMHCGTD